MNNKLLYCLLLLGLIFSFPAWSGKKRCEPLLIKLHNIQTQQRQGYSIKKGISLQAKADKVRKQWWQCENNINSPRKKNKKKAKKVQKKKVISTTFDPVEIAKEIKPFATSKAIVVKSRFKGKKQQAWLDYYQAQKPDKCKRPKTTQIFAFCMEDKASKQDIFDRSYQNTP